MRDYRKTRPEVCRAVDRKRRDLPHRVAARDRWREEHPELCRAYTRAAWKRDYAKNPEKYHDRYNRWRACQKGPQDPRVVALYFIAKWLRQQGDDVHVDHIIPVSKGGGHTYENLQILPAVENLRKGAKLPV